MKRIPLFLLAVALALYPKLAARGETTTLRDDSAAEELGWQLATKAYTFRTITLFETIDLSRQLGVKYFEVNPRQKMSPEDPTEVGPAMTSEQRAAIKKKFAEAGVKPMSFGVLQLKTDEAAARSYFQFAKDVGITTLVSEPPAEAFEMLDRLCEEYGLRIAIHNHPAPSPYALPETELAVFATRSARIGSCADVGHWTRSSLSAVECLHRLEGHVIQLHFKDVNEAKKDVPWGTGKTDVKGMLAELQRQKFRGLFSMEYEGADPAKLMDELRESIAFFDAEARRIVKAKPVTQVPGPE